MANEIKVAVRIQYLQSSVLTRQIPLKESTIDTTSELLSDNTQIVGVTHELIALGDITDDAFVQIDNLHATALVQVGHDVAAAFVGLIDIPAGGPPAILPRASTLATTYLLSDTASTPVRVTMIKVV